jgi:hypothetical protein
MRARCNVLWSCQDANRLAGFEESQDGQHSSVTGFALGQVELGENAADVLFHCAPSDTKI